MKCFIQVQHAKRLKIERWLLIPVSRQTPDRAIGLSGAVDWPWPSAPAAEIEFAVITANLMLGAMVGLHTTIS